MNLYECTFIVRQDLPVQDVHKLTDRFVGIVTQGEGKLIKKEYWGLRNLAYKLKNDNRGHYVMLGIESSQATLKELERNLKINEDILKHLFVRVEKLDDTPSHMMREPADSSALDRASEE